MSGKKMCLERRMYEAWNSGRGINFTADELRELFRDDAVCSRVGNAIALEAGVDPELCEGMNDPDLFGSNGSVKKFLSRFNLETSEATNCK